MLTAASAAVKGARAALSSAGPARAASMLCVRAHTHAVTPALAQPAFSATSATAAPYSTSSNSLAAAAPNAASTGAATGSKPAGSPVDVHAYTHTHTRMHKGDAHVRDSGAFPRPGASKASEEGASSSGKKASRARVPYGQSEDFKTLNARRPSAHTHRVTSLDADPYGWDVSERDVREAPLWMVYEAEREEVQLRHATRRKKEEMTDNATEIRPPMRDEFGRAYATGRRKTATARVWVTAGDGNFVVNGLPLAQYFPRVSDRIAAMEPLIATRTCGAFDVWLTVKGGGLSGQSGAVRHGLANALSRYDPYLKPLLRELKLIHRDPRMVERKKPGQMKARRKFQWVKR